MSVVIEVDAAVLHSNAPPRVEGPTDKDSRGRVLLIAGSSRSPGAALLAGEAALRGGAGKVLLATAQSICHFIGIAAPEFGIAALRETPDGEPDADDGTAGDGTIEASLRRCDAVLLGPGLMNETNARFLALRVFRSATGPVVLDAAAIGAFARDFDSVRAASASCILTPHAGEMATLMGLSRDVVENSAREVAAEAARLLHCTVVLKGAETFIATADGSVFCHRSGVAGLATAGSGDTLAGLMAALLARGAAPLSASLWSVFIHARAGMLLSESIGRIGFLAREIPPLFPSLMQRLEESARSG